MPAKRKNKASRRALIPSVLLVLLLGALGVITWMLQRDTWIGEKTDTPEGATNAAPTAIAGASTNDVIGTGTNLLTPESLREWVAKEESTADLVNTGSAMLEAARYQDAILCFRRAIELKPDDEDATFNLAFAYARVGASDLAIRYYKRAIEIFPEYADAHNNLGNLYLRQGQFDQAIEHFNAAIQSSPELSLAHNGLGRALAQQGRPSDALPHFQEAARLDPGNVEAHFNIGSAFTAMGRTNEALAQFQQVLRMRPDFAPAKQALARLQRSQ